MGMGSRALIKNLKQLVAQPDNRGATAFGWKLFKKRGGGEGVTRLNKNSKKITLTYTKMFSLSYLSNKV